MFEQNLYLAVMLRHFPGQVLIRGQNLAEPDKSPHDGNVDLNGLLAAENAGEHGDAFLREGAGWESGVAVLLGTGHSL